MRRVVTLYPWRWAKYRNTGFQSRKSWDSTRYTTKIVRRGRSPNELPARPDPLRGRCRQVLHRGRRGDDGIGRDYRERGGYRKADPRSLPPAPSSAKYARAVEGVGSEERERELEAEKVVVVPGEPVEKNEQRQNPPENQREEECFVPASRAKSPKSGSEEGQSYSQGVRGVMMEDASNAMPALGIESVGPRSEVLQWDRLAVRERLLAPFAREYYAREDIDLRALADRIGHLPPPRVFGPEYDRERIVDFNSDLYPRDEFLASRAEARPAQASPVTPPASQ